MRIKEKIAAAVSSSSVQKAYAAVFAVAASGAAMAADDPGLDAIGELATRAGGYITAAAAAAVVVAGGFWGISMMKKAFSRAG